MIRDHPTIKGSQLNINKQTPPPYKWIITTSREYCIGHVPTPAVVIVTARFFFPTSGNNNHSFVYAAEAASQVEEPEKLFDSSATVSCAASQSVYHLLHNSVERSICM